MVEKKRLFPYIHYSRLSRILKIIHSELDTWIGDNFVAKANGLHHDGFPLENLFDDNKGTFRKNKKNVLGVSYPLSVIQNFLIPIELDILNDERYHLYFTCQSFDQRSIC